MDAAPAPTPAPFVSAQLQQFVNDELLRAPLLLNQLIDSLRGGFHAGLRSGVSLAQRAAATEVVAAAHRERARMELEFVQSLRAQVGAGMAAMTPTPRGAASGPARRNSDAGVTKSGLRLTDPVLSLVHEETVAAEAATAHMVETIVSAAEHELRELQTYVSALAGDMDHAMDYNPFTPAVLAKALQAAVQVLPGRTASRVLFLQIAAEPLAQVLRRGYAAASSRLESQGVQPAAFRTLVLQGGMRSSGRTEITFSPDLDRLRDGLAQQPGASARVSGPGTDAPGLGVGARRPMAPHPGAPRAPLLDPRLIELVKRLFEAIGEDRRVPPDVQALLALLQPAALRLARVDATLTDRDKHPLWRCINRLVFAAEVTPHADDPERIQLLRMAASTIHRLCKDEQPTAELYAWALDRFDKLLAQRLQRHQSMAATQIGILQNQERDLSHGQLPNTALPLALDVPQLDTVPAALLESEEPRSFADGESRAWLDQRVTGDWVRMFLQGQWHRAQLLWVGSSRQFWLFADGASDLTWSIRRSALLMMHATGLLKTLHQRSIVGSAAARVHAQSELQAKSRVA